MQAICIYLVTSTHTSDWVTQAGIDMMGVVTSVGQLGSVKRKSDSSELSRRDITLLDQRYCFSHFFIPWLDNGWLGPYLIAHGHQLESMMHNSDNSKLFRQARHNTPVSELYSSVRDSCMLPELAREVLQSIDCLSCPSARPTLWLVFYIQLRSSIDPSQCQRTS